jgi:hypothetical protein
MRQRNGKADVLVQWAVSWASVEEMAGQAVSQIMGTRTRDGAVEFLVNWSCSWTDVDEELMKGDLWQPFLDQEAKNEADETAGPKEKEKVKAAKRGFEDAGTGTRRSLRGKGTQ